MKALLLVLLLGSAAYAKPVLLAEAAIEGYSKPGRIYLYKADGKGYYFQLLNANLSNEPSHEVINYYSSADNAMAFRRLYFRACQKVLNMKPSEKCQTVVGGMIIHAVDYGSAFSPPLKLEISKGTMSDPRRRIYFTSTNYDPYSRFCIILTGEGSHRKAFEAMLNKIK